MNTKAKMKVVRKTWVQSKYYVITGTFALEDHWREAIYETRYFFYIDRAWSDGHLIIGKGQVLARCLVFETKKDAQNELKSIKKLINTRYSKYPLEKYGNLKIVKLKLVD